MGLNLADTFVANPNPAEQAALHDWSQAILHNKGVLMAPTGYGLGEKTSLAYSARLLAGFASEGLDGTSSIGQGLVRAKQEYVRLGVPSVYDIKALHEATFYGLPMYRLGSAGRVMGSFLPEEGTPTGPPPANATTSVTYQPAASALEQVTTPGRQLLHRRRRPAAGHPEPAHPAADEHRPPVAERQAHRPGRRP